MQIKFERVVINQVKIPILKKNQGQIVRMEKPVEKQIKSERVVTFRKDPNPQDKLSVAEGWAVFFLRLITDPMF